MAAGSKPRSDGAKYLTDREFTAIRIGGILLACDREQNTGGRRHERRSRFVRNGRPVARTGV